MKILLKYLPTRRIELLLVVLGAASLMVLIAWNGSSVAGSSLALMTMELVLPLGIGLVVAGLLANDPALDLLLSMPAAAVVILAQRLVFVISCGAAVELVIQGWIGLWSIPLPIIGMRQFLIWLAPLILFSGVATVASLLRGHSLDGTAAVLLVWAATLLSMPFIDRLCKPAAESCLAAITSPAMTELRPSDPAWLLNRILLIIVGFLLLTLGLLLVRWEERLLDEAHSD